MTLDEINTTLDPLFHSLMGMRVTEISGERAVAELTVRPELCTDGNIPHGGAYMAFADTIGAVATVVNLTSNTRTVTIESKTNFIGGAPVGSKVMGKCTPFRTTMVWQTVIRNEAGKTLAVVSQTQMVIPT